MIEMPTRSLGQRRPYRRVRGGLASSPEPHPSIRAPLSP